MNTLQVDKFINEESWRRPIIPYKVTDWVKSRCVPKVPFRDTIKCPRCGHDTGLNPGGFHMVIPPGGLICGCGAVIIKGDSYTLSNGSY